MLVLVLVWGMVEGEHDWQGLREGGEEAGKEGKKGNKEWPLIVVFQLGRGERREGEREGRKEGEKEGERVDEYVQGRREWKSADT